MVRYYWFFTVVFATAIFVLICGCAVSPPAPQAASDLAFNGSLTWSPASPTIGQTVTITAPIINVGAVNADACTWTVQRDSVSGFLTGTVPTLAAGASSNLGISFSEPATGTHTYTVILNSTGSLTESSTSNNSQAVTITTTGPDLLAVSNLSVTSASQPITTIQSLTLSVQVTNVDTVNSYSAAYRITRDGVVDSYTVNGTTSLTPGQIQILSIPLNADSVAGIHTYTFTIDPANALNDPVTSNNAASQAITVAAAAAPFIPVVSN